jgi:hypothetical protein
MKRAIIIFGFIFSLSSCDLFEEAKDILEQPNIAEGLKEALKVGTDTAVSKLALADGYLKDEAVKILLPDELESQIAAFKSININIFGIGNVTGEDLYNTGLPILGISSLADLEDDLIVGVNRAAESAAKEAAPIFFDAITGITIADAESILYGPNDAATTYLKDNTFSSLFNLYEPKIDNAINNVKVGEKSVEVIYSDFVDEYNSILSTQIPTSLINSTPLFELVDLQLIENPDISSFATEKGLDGLFLKIEEEEANIRENPLARVTDILEEVFGLLD